MDKILKVILVLLGGTFIVLQGLAYEAEGAAIASLMLILLLVLYHKFTTKRYLFFSAFLLVFAVAQLINYLTWEYSRNVPKEEIDYFYYGTNVLFILSYIFLIIKVAKEFKLAVVFKELYIPIIILIVLDIFCVILVTDTTKGSAASYSLEFGYNTVIMLLLSVALIDYMYRNDNKSMLFLVGSICIVFSEIIQLAYYYVLDNSNLGFIYALFLVIAFAVFYLQSQLQFTGPQPKYLDDHLEV